MFALGKAAAVRALGKAAAVRALGTAAAVLASAGVAAVAVLDALVPSAHRAVLEQSVGWPAAVSGLALVLPGTLLLARLPRHPVAWVLVITGLHWILDAGASAWLAYATARNPALPGAELAFWVFNRAGASLLLSVPLVLLLYPGGRLPSGRWRVASLVSLGSTALLPLVFLVVPSGVVSPGVAAPLRGLDLDPTTVTGLPDGFWTAVLRAAGVGAALSVVVPFAVVVRRYRRATGVDRLRMRWLLWAAVVDVLVMLSTLAFPQGWTNVALPVAVALTGAAVAAGIGRPGLLDVDRLLSGTLLYGGLTIAVVLVDLAVVGGAAALLGHRLAERDAALVALTVVLAFYTPLRDRLWRLVRRVALGRRDDPYGVVAGLAEQLERSDEPEEQLLAVARTVAEAFRSEYVAVEVDRSGGERLVASHGRRPAETRALAITFRGEEVGRLVLPRGGPRAALSARDERLLGDVVRQAAAASRAGHLAVELQRSRERLVTACEEERRRLRRDLHDGLGPSLGAVALRIDAARNLASAAPEKADDLLRRAREDVTTAVADVRRLVHDLRPPALDDVGLLGAVRQQAERLRGPGLTISVDGDTSLDALPAAVEVAAYRVASEALTNVVRHARASTCHVRLSADDGELLVEVVDNGVGIRAATPSGVGLVSLRERAAELGGRCEILSPPAGGTVVRALLPLARPEVSRA